MQIKWVCALLGLNKIVGIFALKNDVRKDAILHMSCIDFKNVPANTV